MTVKEIKVYQNLMGANEEWAAKTRDVLRERSLLMLNLIGSPGSGKTTLLEMSVDYLRARHPFAVLEGDVETTNDAQRLHALDIPVSQLLSGGSCHLEAKLVHHALVDLPLDRVDVVFVENVGNMVCPAEFDIGEMAKVAVLSVTEGEDKPLKYPLLFREAKAAVLSKQDLLPHLNFDVEACRRNIREVNGNIPIFDVAATGEGIADWGEWVAEQVKKTMNDKR